MSVPPGQPPADPLDWRPQRPRATRRPAAIRDPILEPLWSGLRVLAHFTVQPAGDAGANLVLLDDDGVDAAAIAPQATDSLRAAVMALDAVIDGVLTHQTAAAGRGTAIVARADVSPVAMLLPSRPELDYPARTRPAPDATLAFVALDLLRVDGQPLLDLPLLERKRLLESVIRPDAHVRLSPLARPPLSTWFASWRSAGFRGVMMKAANSRYRPGASTTEWSEIIQTPRG
ncbi:MAG TPA: hypothetical protein VNW68_01400 [Candidatus Limnocylindria bacterium]|nr:hypothetical protein [Candidatus Limnocylindria bacterium]